jgi:hypothetical protein
MIVEAVDAYNNTILMGNNRKFNAILSPNIGDNVIV